MTKLILEKDVEKKVCDEAAKLGIVSIKLSGPYHRGVPDRIFLHRGKVLFMEMKKPGGRPTKLQEMWLERLEEQGFEAIVCDDPDAGILALREMVK